ncbi:MAG: hypothetical protein GDA45_01025 [Chromatiales bacterium]|nr:hypothetical protein [Chromatiales bacterium]
MQEIDVDELNAFIKALEERQQATDRLFEKTRQELREISLQADKRFEETRQELREISLQADRRAKEADKRAEEADKRFKEMSLEADKRSKAIDKRFEETRQERKEMSLEADKRFAEMSLEAEKRFKETERVIKESDLKTDKQIRELRGEFTSRWGRLVESLVSGDLVKLLKARNIDIDRVYGNDKGIWQGQQYEFDIVACNGTDIVVTEVKSMLNIKSVDYFLERMKLFKLSHSNEVRDKNLYGAVAYLHVDNGVDVYAQRQGLFVIRATGGSASITNQAGFTPKSF